MEDWRDWGRAVPGFWDSDCRDRRPGGWKNLARSQHDSAGDRAAAQIGHGFVDLSEGAGGYLRMDFSGGGHGENCAEILASAHGGCLDADFRRGHRNGWEADRFSRQADDQENSGGPDAEKGVVVGGFRGGSYDCGMHAAHAAQFLDDIYGGRVQSGGCAKTFRTREFFIGDINGGDGCAQPDADLHSDLAQAADTEDRQTLAWLDFGVLQGAIHRDTGAEQRRGIGRGKLLRNFQRVAGRSFDEFGEASIHGDAGDLLLDAEIFVAVAAEFTFAATPVQPGDADAIADLEIVNGGSFFHDAACDFVAEDERFFDDARELGPIGIGQVQIGVADATGFDGDQDFVRAGLGLRDIFDAQRGFEFAQYGGFHYVHLSELVIVTQACAEEARAAASGAGIGNESAITAGRPARKIQRHCEPAR